MGKRGSISSFLEGKKIVIYGIGYVARKFYHALVAQGLDSNVEYFVVSQRRGEQTAMNGIDVRVIQELKAGDDTMICIAVHETRRKEIEKLLENKNIKNYIWISPYDLAELFYGKPKEEAVPIPVNKIIRSCKDYRFAVKYLAIENYFGINDYGYDIYLKAQQLNCEKQTATKRLKAFLDLIDNEYIVSVIADTLSFYYGYNQNYDNFSYWYWRHLMQSSLYHELDGKLNKERFIMFLGRVLFIYVLSGKNGDDLRLKPFDSCLSEYWMLYFEDVYSVVRILDEILDKKDFKRTMIGFSNKLFFTSYPQIVEFMNEKTGGDKQVVMAKMPVLVKDIREKYVEKFMDDFSSNRLPLDKCEFPCNFIGSFLPSFLCYLKALNGQGCNTDVAQMLQRDENGKPDLAADEADCYSNILVDSFGGTFCIHGEVQRKYFAARSVFYMTIFHFCEKNIISTIKVGKS